MLDACFQIVLLPAGVLESNQVHRQEPKTLSHGHRPALRSAESVRGSTSAITGGRRSLGNDCFRPASDRERRAGRTGSLFFWRDREVDFVVDSGGRMELFEAKWTELPDVGDTVNLDFVRNVVAKSRVTAGALVSRTPNSFLFPSGFRALPVTELG
jgi:hypothetical protein